MIPKARMNDDAFYTWIADGMPGLSTKNRIKLHLTAWALLAKQKHLDVIALAILGVIWLSLAPDLEAGAAWLTGWLAVGAGLLLTFSNNNCN